MRTLNSSETLLFCGHIRYFLAAMYKTRNTGTGNGMRVTRGIGGMLYPGECHQTFRVISPNIPGMSPNIPGNVLKHSGEWRQTFRGMSPNIPVNSGKHSGECPQTFQGISSKIPRNPLNRLAFKFDGRAPKHWTQFY